MAAAVGPQEGVDVTGEAGRHDACWFLARRPAQVPGTVVLHTEAGNQQCSG